LAKPFATSIGIPFLFNIPFLRLETCLDHPSWISLISLSWIKLWDACEPLASSKHSTWSFVYTTKVLQPPFFWGYDLNVTCAYHGGVSGHSIKHCMTLKHKVQGLIDAGWLKFEENRLWILTLASNTIHGSIWRFLLDVSNDSLGFSSLCHYCKPQL